MVLNIVTGQIKQTCFLSQALMFYPHITFSTRKMHGMHGFKVHLAVCDVDPPLADGVVGVVTLGASRW